jgi:hypothetical protein
MVDSVPAELLELQTRFETWRANRFLMNSGALPAPRSGVHQESVSARISDLYARSQSET